MPTPVVVRAPPEALERHSPKTKKVIPTLCSTGGDTRSLDDNNDNDDAVKSVSFSPSSRALDSTSPSNTADHDRVSRTDISASPRLPYYIICCVASICCLVSLYVFDDNYKRYKDEFPERFIFEWKQKGTEVVAAMGIAFTGFVLLAHLDKKIFPKLWRLTFRDGSHGELAIIVLLVALWTAGVYLSTTPFSLGEVVHNVFFSSWIALGSCIAALNEWFRGKGLRTPRDHLLLDRPSRKTLHWAWLVIFGSVLFASCIELYANRYSDYIYFGVGALSDVADSTWREWVSVSSAQFGVALLGLSLDLLRVKPFNATLFGCLTLRLDWQRFEGWFLLGFVGLNAYTVLEYTGVEGYLNSPNNPYFSVWGLFFVSILALSAWMGEHNMLVVSYTKEKGLRLFYHQVSPTNEASS